MRLNVKYLKAVLAKKGWSVRQFAIKTGLSQSTISRILNNKRGAGAKALGAIHKVLKNEPINKLFFMD